VFLDTVTPGLLQAAVPIRQTGQAACQ